MEATIDFTTMTRPAGPWVHHANASGIRSIRAYAAPPDGLVVELDGTRMHTLDELFREYVREF